MAAFFWFLPWRILAGLTGGVLMVLAGPAVQAVVPHAMRNLASGAVITGVGLGIMVSALLVPAILPWGLPATWLALACIAGLLTILSWKIWPDVEPPPPASSDGPPLPEGGVMFLVVYGFAGFAATAHMVFWPDFIARGLGLGMEKGGLAWLGFGIAASLGGIIFSRLADWLGAAQAIAIALLIQVCSLVLPLLWTGSFSLLLSTITAGVTVLGITALALVRSRELGGEAGPRLWRLATAIWGVTTAAAGFILSWILELTDSHLPMFALGFGRSPDQSLTERLVYDASAKGLTVGARNYVRPSKKSLQVAPAASRRAWPHWRGLELGGPWIAFGTSPARNSPG